MPARNKLQVLLSPDAWRVPSADVRAAIDELLAGGDTLNGQQVLKNYCQLLGSDDPRTVAVVASGLADLADLYATGGVVQSALGRIAEVLPGHRSGQVGEALTAAFLRLERQAEAHGNYAAVQHSLVSLERLRGQTEVLAGQLYRRLQLENRAAELLESALRDPAPELLKVLKHIPQSAAEQVACRFGRAVTRDECERLKQLAVKLGPIVREYCQNALLDGSDARALEALRILVALDSKTVEQTLPARLQNWSGVNQATAVQHISASGAPSRGSLLLKLLPVLNPLVIPQALDEAGLAGCTEVGPLLEMAHGEGLAEKAPYTQLKAIEALGRLRLQVAIADLSDLVTAHSLWGALHPREIRIAALQALLRIDPRAGLLLSAKSGISDRELWLTPLSPSDENWVRHRRYPRIAIHRNLQAEVTAGEEAFTLDLEELSLGGGIGRVGSTSRPAVQAELEIRTGFRTLRFQALVREQRPSRVAFEIASISLEDRSRLRSLLNAQSDEST
jgi:hypothetical protein